MLTFNPQDPFSCFVTQSLSMKSAVENAQRFAMFDVPLLIQGETGTGKDLLAKACHFASLRREKKFIAVNCAGLPDEDAESEMFGRKVGDSETIGFFEYANEGTVLLDGITELSLSLQAKLLRFLTDGFTIAHFTPKHFAFRIFIRQACTVYRNEFFLTAQARKMASFG